MKQLYTLVFFLFGTVCLTSQCLVDSVYIKAILVDPTGTNNNYDTNDNGTVASEDEYVEICNASTQTTVDVSGWQFGDDDSAPFPDFVMPDSTFLAPGDCLLLVNNYCPDLGDPVDCIPPDGIINMNYSGTGMLGNSGDIIAMANADGSVSCSVVYGNVSCDSIDVLDILPFDIDNCESWGSDIDGCPLLISGDSCTYLAQALPVELIEFGVQRYDDDKALIFWSTASEVNNDRFEVEWSDNGSAFSLLGQVYAQDNPSERQDYQFLHTDPEAGFNYYRLKQIDLDGKFAYSGIRSLRMDYGYTPEIVPNISSDMVRIYGKSPDYSLMVFDLNGRLVMDVSSIETGESLDISGLIPAYYSIRFFDGQKVYFGSFVKI